MNLVNKHGTIVLGIDFHFTTLPPFNPWHPFIGLVFDPMDYIPFIGATIKINGLRRGVSDTSGMLVMKKHIPLFSGAFVEAPMIAHQSVNFFGSVNTFAQGRRLSPTTYMKMSCSDVGIPLALHAGEKFKPTPSLFAPTSFSIPLPTGLPVMLGGPFVPDLAGAVINLVASYGFSALLKGIGKLGGRLFKKEAAEITESTLGKSKEKTICVGDPVDVITGRVIYAGCDFELPGMLPLRWERNWYSDSGFTGFLGHGTTCLFDTHLRLLPGGGMALLLPDGRSTGFAKPLPGEGTYNREEKLTLTNAGDHFTVLHHPTRRIFKYESNPYKNDQYRLSKILNEQGFSIAAHYNNALLSEIVDSAGRVLKIDTDVNARITSISIGQLPLVTYAYNDAGDLCTITDALHQSTRTVFERHLMVKKTDRNGQAFYWKYDGLNKGARCVHTWGDGGLLEVHISYHDGYNVSTTASGHSTTYHYDERKLCTQVTDAMGNHRFTDYTAFEETYREIDEEGYCTGYRYDDRGNRTGIIHPDETEEAFVYDVDDLLTMYIDAEGNATIRVYNENRQPESVIYPDNAITSYDYDTLKRLSAVSDNDGKRTQLQYDAQDNLSVVTAPDGRATRWDYDSMGRCIRRVDPVGSVQSLIYDPLGRPTRIQQPDGNIIWLQYNAYEEVIKARDSQHEVAFTYTPLGSLKQRVEKNASLQYRYDNDEELVSIINEHQEQYSFQRNGRGEIISETGFDGSTKRYHRFNNGWVKKIEHPGDKFTLHEYNGCGRVARTEHSDGSWEIFNYNKNGQLIEATNEQCLLYFDRDDMGRVIRERSSVSGQAYEVNSVYNRLSQRTAVSSSLGAAIDLDYTTLGQVSNMTAQHRGVHASWKTALQYNDLGLETARWLPGGIVNHFEYDHAGHPLRQYVRSGKRETRKRHYTWNVNDRLISMLNEQTHGIVNYNHDDFGNLAWSEYENGTKQYRTPDTAGNIHCSPQQDDRSYGAGGQLTWNQGWHYRYDTGGNLLEKSDSAGKSWNYDWYGSGMLQRVRRPDGLVVSFEYDALGRRISKIAGDTITRWVWDGNTPLHEWTYPLASRPAIAIDDMGKVEALSSEPVPALITWVFNEGSFIPAAKLTDEEQYSIITDYLGTPVEMYNHTGQKTWDCELDIYGKARTLAKGELGDCPFRYQGQYEDVETGLCYNRFRYYSAEDGVYLSKDPIGLRGTNPTEYAFVKDTCNRVDVFGLSDCEFKRIRVRVTEILSEHSDIIKKLDPDAKIGFRGSTAKGIKGPHKGYAPFDPKSFDVDAFIVSDKLYNNFELYKKSDYWRAGSKYSDIESVSNEIHKKLMNEFSGYRTKDDFEFRIFKSSKLGPFQDEGAIFLP